MKREMEGLKTEVGDLRAANRRIIATLVRLEGKIDDLGERMATKDDLASVRSAVDQKIDGFARLFEESRFRWAVHAETLSGHDKRLTKLEARRA